VIICDEDKKEIYRNAKIVKCLNHTDYEYRAILYGLAAIEGIINSNLHTYKHTNNIIIIYNDSASNIENIKNNSIPKNNNILSYDINKKIQALYLRNKQQIDFQWIPREENFLADELSKNKLADHCASDPEVYNYMLCDLQKIIESQQRRINLVEDTPKGEKIKYVYEQVKTLYEYMRTS